jgi:hypothetical protein
MDTRPARLDYSAILLAAMAAFAFSLVWYSPFVFGSVWLKAKGADATAMPLWKLLVAPLREVITAWLVASLIRRLGISDRVSAASLGLTLWLAFYVVQLSGAVIFDGMPFALGAVHAGDWLGKMLLIALVLSSWHRPEPATA